MNQDMSLDLGKVSVQAESLAQQGVVGAFVGGTTGESLSLTTTERMELAEEWMKHASKHNLIIIVHVGAESIMDARALASHAQEIGAHAISLMPPTFLKPPCVEAVVQTVAFVSKGSPALPLYYYHIPCMTGVMGGGTELLEFVKQAARRIPNFNGVKYTDFNMHRFAELMDYRDEQGRKFQMMFGRDEQMNAAIMMGCDAFVGSTYNYMGKVYNRIIEAMNKGEFSVAAAYQRKAMTAISIFCKYKGNANKCMMEAIGLPMGPSRLPLVTPDPQQMSEMKAELRSAGFFDALL